METWTCIIKGLAACVAVNIIVNVVAIIMNSFINTIVIGNSGCTGQYADSYQN